MRYALSVLLAAHGIAHLVGFLVPWRFLSSPDTPYTTTLLAGRVDVGDAGIRALGVLWLLTAVVTAGSAIGLALQARWAETILLPVVLVSLALCLLHLPQARVGLALNVGLVVLLLLHPTMGAGALRWQRQNEDARAGLPGAGASPAGLFTSASTALLPAPVTRYFRHVLPEGHPLRFDPAFTQTGQFRMGDTDDSWKPMTASQRFAIGEPGFVWNARIEAMPLVPVFVRDSYVAGAARMQASILGLYTVMDAPVSADLNAGALQRYLGEAVWFPTALLPVFGVHWDPIDDDSAKATLSDHGTTVSLIFDFTPSGDVARVWSPTRLREVNGAYVPTPWVVTCRDHATINDMRIPTSCEAAWQLPSGLLPYRRARLAPAP